MVKNAPLCSGGKNKSEKRNFMGESGFFQEGVAQSKSDAMPLSFQVHFGTDQTFKMRYITSMNTQWFQKYQPSKLNNNKKVPKRTFFSIFQLWRMVFLEPLGVQRRHVLHIEGLIYAKVDIEAQGLDSTFTICHALVKKAILHLKRGFVQTHLLTTI